MAPKLIRFPETPKKFINVIAKSIASGITDATTNPARRFPNNNTNTKITIKAPSARFFETVFIALSTNLVRSKNGSISKPSGKVLEICSIRVFTFLITFEEFSPFSIITTPPTTSLLSL
ncbi:hypothetical protein D3C80_1187100 [compost metagenome]